MKRITSTESEKFCVIFLVFFGGGLTYETDVGPEMSALSSAR